MQFDIAYRLGHDLIGENVGSFKLARIFGAEAFCGINSDAGSGDPALVRHAAQRCMPSLIHLICLCDAFCVTLLLCCLHTMLGWLSTSLTACSGISSCVCSADRVLVWCTWELPVHFIGGWTWSSA